MSRRLWSACLGAGVCTVALAFRRLAWQDGRRRCRRRGLEFESRPRHGREVGMGRVQGCPPAGVARHGHTRHAAAHHHVFGGEGGGLGRVKREESGTLL